MSAPFEEDGKLDVSTGLAMPVELLGDSKEDAFVDSEVSDARDKLVEATEDEEGPGVGFSDVAGVLAEPFAEVNVSCISSTAGEVLSLGPESEVSVLTESEGSDVFA